MDSFEKDRLIRDLSWVFLMPIYIVVLAGLMLLAAMVAASPFYLAYRLLQYWAVG